MTQSLSLYLHIPFCRHRCAYCDFNTYTSLTDLQEPYADALCAEIRQVAGDDRRPAHTLFFGGGTPSLMSVGAMGRILQTVNDCFVVSPDAEITMEANPDTVTADYLADLRKLGVNRLSFGVQSANPAELQFLERTHNFQTVIDAVAMSRKAGFDNINLDLIYGLPHQSLASWQQSLEAVLALEPEHLSLYCLIIEPGTPLQRWLKQGRVPLPDPDLAADQYELAIEMMATHGFGHYEISNWAKEGRECRHNLQYWRNQPYLGLGAGAHGYANRIRYHVVKQPRVYIRRLQMEAPPYPLSSAVADHNLLTQQEAMQDTIITQLRLLKEGLDLPAFTQTFHTPLETAYAEILPDLYNWDLIHKEDDKLRLTPKGTLLSNQVFYRFM